jgi:hypothetical protein
MAITSPPSAPITDDIYRLTGMEILRQYGPDVFGLMGRLQASGIVPYRRTAYDEAVTTQVRKDIIAKEGDCRCGKIDCWKEEMGLDQPDR